MTCPAEPLRVSSSGASDATETVSSKFPTSSVSGSSRRSPILTSTPSRASFLKPESSAVILYAPGARYGIENPPSLSVIAVETTLVATWVAVTVTPGSRPPWASVMRPVMPPRKSCASAGGAAIAQMHSVSASAARLTYRLMVPPPIEVSGIAGHAAGP